MNADEGRLAVGERAGEVATLFARPADAWALYVLAHGAGAGMRHAFMEETSEVLFARGIATYRYQFPYVEAGRRRPDPPELLESTVAAAVAEAARAAPGLPLFAGGKSMGGRMTSRAAPRLAGVRGLVFLGFPLHAPKRPSLTRAAYLADVPVPMLFIQGTRDDLADLTLMRAVCAPLGARATLHVVEDADHSFKVLKRTGRSAREVIDGIADTIAAWMRAHSAET